MLWVALVLSLMQVNVFAQEPVSHLGISTGGHYITVNERPVVLVGDSGTQCVLQDANLNYRQWVDDCVADGLNAIHIWTFIAPRQTADGTVLEERYGYTYPGLTPWTRHKDGPLAADQLPYWNLKEFDEGEGPGHYWSRLRDLCEYAKTHGLTVGITVFFGWPKHQAEWRYHPLNRRNGGPVRDRQPIISKAQMIASPGTEVLHEKWSEIWSAEKKTQWIWERFAEKLIKETLPFGNVWYVFMDEHSYEEGNCGDHFADFFRSRGALWCDWKERREQVDFVASPTLNNVDKSANMTRGFLQDPPKPYIFLEGPPYMGDNFRRSLWTVLIGGGHFFFHNDYEQETPQTGIMSYDPNVPRLNTGTTQRKWIGIACRFFNGEVVNLDMLEPYNEICKSGDLCLASPGREYVIYASAGSDESFTMDLSSLSGSFACQLLNPRTGELKDLAPVEGGQVCQILRPDAQDWVLHLTAQRDINP